jgi:hypothetical protein
MIMTFALTTGWLVVELTIVPAMEKPAGDVDRGRVGAVCAAIATDSTNTQVNRAINSYRPLCG